MMAAFCFGRLEIWTRHTVSGCGAVFPMGEEVNSRIFLRLWSCVLGEEVNSRISCVLEVSSSKVL